MVSAQVAVLAHATCVVCSISMDAVKSAFFATTQVIAIFAHAFGVERLICVRAVRYFFTMLHLDDLGDWRLLLATTWH